MTREKEKQIFKGDHGFSKMEKVSKITQRQASEINVQ